VDLDEDEPGEIVVILTCKVQGEDRHLELIDFEVEPILPG
jgi:hypothetical protein